MKESNSRYLFFINSIPPDYGGGYLRVYKMASRFQQKGHLAGIITLTTSKQYRNLKNPLISPDKIKFIAPKFLSAISTFIYLLKRRNDFDILYICSPHWFTIASAFTAKLLGKRLIVGVTLSRVDSPAAVHSNFFINLYYRLKNTQFDICDKIVVNSPAVLEECKQSSHLASKVVLIPNPVDVEIFKKNDSKSQLTERLGIPTIGKKILFAGTINERKGADILPQYFRRVTEIYPDTTLIICGNRVPEFSDKLLDNLFSEFPPQSGRKRILIFEEAKNVNELMQVSDLLIFPSRNEGLPNVVIEAMATQLPIVCNTLPGITDYLLQTGSLVVDNNIDDFVRKTEDIFLQKDYVKALVQKNIQFVERNLTIDRVDQEFLLL